MTMVKESGIEMISSLLPLSLHSLGIYLLRKSRNSFSNKSQYHLLVHNSISQIIFIVFGILARIVLMCGDYKKAYISLCSIQYINSFLVCYFVMVFMTLERFFEVYLNIRYPIFWCEKYTKTLLCTLWAVACILVFGVIFYPSLDEKLLYKFCFLYFYPSLEFLLSFLSVFIYTYIFVKLHKTPLHSTTTTKEMTKNIQPEELQKVRSSMDNSNATKSLIQLKNHKKKKTSHFYVPFLILVTYFLFIVVPDAIGFFICLLELEMIPAVKTYIYFSYLFGISCDVFIYVLLYKSLRIRFMRMIFINSWQCKL